MPDLARLLAIVHGLVQGVNFRYYTVRQARGLGLTGYVRNRWDRTVEVVAEGEKESLEELLEWLKVGPPSAVVERVDARWESYRGEFRSFEVRF